MKKILLKLFTAIENSPLTLATWVITFVCLIAFRLTIDLGLEKFPELSLSQLFFQWSHLFLFFLFSYLLLLPLVMAVGRVSLEKAARVLLFGFLIILFPPIIDKIIFGDGLYWSFYIFDSLGNMPERFFTFFGEKPHLGITYGVRAEVAFVLLGIFLYGMVKTSNLRRTLAFTVLAYVILFVLGTLPSWLAYLMLAHTTPLFSITDTHIAELFLSPEKTLGDAVGDLRSALSYKMSLVLLPLNFVLVVGLWFWNSKKGFLAFLKNVRWPQIFYHNGLFIVGMLLAIIYTDGAITPNYFTLLSFIVLCLAVTATWLCSVVWNDVYDQAIDAKTNNWRPLITGDLSLQQYRLYGCLLFAFSVSAAALVSFQASLLLVSYQAIATLYSVPPFRLKRFLGIATGLASLAGLIILFLGYTLLNPSHTLSDLPMSLVVYLALVYGFLLPLKDFKDIAGDRADSIYTLPVVLGEQKAKTLMSVLAFLIFVGSIFVLHTPQLLVWALLFATLAFWLIQRAGTKGSRLTYPRLSGLFMLLAFLYGIGLVVFLF